MPYLQAEWPRAIEELCSFPHIEEAAVLSTCNRMELYVVALSWHRVGSVSYAAAAIGRHHVFLHAVINSVCWFLRTVQHHFSLCIAL